jgi:hypothetical protein
VRHEVKPLTQLLDESRKITKRYAAAQEDVEALLQRRGELLDILVDASLRVPGYQELLEETLSRGLYRANVAFGKLLNDAETSIPERVAQMIQEGWEQEK